jgi:multiple sugar transport system permease protein
MPFIPNLFANHSGARRYLKDEASIYIGLGTLLLVLIVIASIYLSPLLYMGSTAFKSEKQLANPDDPILPKSPQTYHYISPDIETFRFTYRRPLTFDYQGQELPVYEVISQGKMLQYALLEDRGSQGGVFIDTTNPDAGPVEVTSPVAEMDRAVERERLEVPLYYVPISGQEVILGLVEEYDDGSTLWMNPEDTSMAPVQLPLPKSAVRSVRLEKDLYLYHVPIGDDKERELALLESVRHGSIFVDPKTNEMIELDIPAQGLDLVWKYDVHTENFGKAIDQINFWRLLFNTFFIAVVGAFGTTISSTLVAYGFTRFNIPYANILFMIVLATIILPPQVTQIPTFIVFRKLGWIGTWYPLLIPHFFAHAYNIFLLRQYMMGIPLELDEAAQVDGANPIRILRHIIIPAARPAMVAVYLFHFLWSWNEFQQPLIYIGGNPENQVLAVGLQRFVQIYSSQQNLMMAAGVLAMLIPLIVFFLAQRIFMQGVVITGVEK